MSEQKKFLSDRFGNEIAAEIMSGGEPDDLLRDRDLAPKCRLSLQWFQVRRTKGNGPPYIRLSPRAIRYQRAAVAAWFAARTASSTAEYERHSGPGRPKARKR